MIGIVILGLTLVAAIMLSKHPTISAILLIIAVVLSVFNVSWVAGILWLIAAIMLLVRRPKINMHITVVQQLISHQKRMSDTIIIVRTTMTNIVINSKM